MSAATSTYGAESPADVQLPEYSAAEVASHNRKDDIWIIVHGKVFDITNYLQDHPGGAEILIDTAGTDATEAFEDVGHSEDSVEIMQEFLIGTLKGAKEYVPPKKVQLVAQKPETMRQPSGSRPVGTIAGVLGALASILYAYQRGTFGPLVPKNELGQLIPQYFNGIRLSRGGFTNGFLTAAAISAIVGTAVARQAAKFTKVDSGFLRYPPHIKARSVMKADPHLAKGFLDAKEFKRLPLVEKDQLSPNVYRFVFALPNAKGCYPEGLLTGRYLANLTVGDEVEFRGPKGAMRYSKGLCTKLGMVAGGTGITPMYQLIRAICEDERDTTEISLIYANRTEADILLREELEAFARKYPKNFKLWYMLDTAPDGWAYGTGFVNQEVLSQQLPGPSENTKMLLCGPPGMVNATKKTLAAMGFQKAGAMSKMSDQIFCF
ncbi:cytochrome B5 [Aspergillus nomiae NRRL 13137]|uniref:Cytochrome B5 n=1 Tax=Aspergillus nomiae NRRL (strain ATCC 15546 / NRRL 13137 / CBS 260.88 / M93) TaxID=1509407 RepID=A0A0L1JGY3_ASPN3|nr:cytochrome B5 [Aspergillus nomiae NRRL 13137]KNG91030.1 cytochrome B5 [Aspergillus nomiae NRRL 13137]